MKRTARNESWNERLNNVSGSQMTRINAAHESETSQNPFLPMTRPKRKSVIIMNDRIAGILAPERPRYASMNGRQSMAAACDGDR